MVMVWPEHGKSLDFLDGIHYWPGNEKNKDALTFKNHNPKPKYHRSENAKNTF
jgi:hypothetical protein